MPVNPQRLSMFRDSVRCAGTRRPASLAARHASQETVMAVSCGTSWPPILHCVTYTEAPDYLKQCGRHCFEMNFGNEDTSRQHRRYQPAVFMRRHVGFIDRLFDPGKYRNPAPAPTS
jgi:hypothetical protein